MWLGSSSSTSSSSAATSTSKQELHTIQDALFTDLYHEVQNLSTPLLLFRLWLFIILFILLVALSGTLSFGHPFLGAPFPLAILSLGHP